MENKKWYDNMVMINHDPNWHVGEACSSRDEAISFYENTFNKYDYAETVTDVALCVLEQTSIIPSKHLMWRGSKYLQKKENGKDVDYTRLKGLYRCYEEFNVDGVEIFIEEMKKLNIRPWITVRTNDAHCGDPNVPAFLRPDLFYEEYEAGHLLGKEYGWYQGAYNFRTSKYPELLLKYIEEVLDKYDIFGFELDFMRFQYCFDFREHPDCHPIMTEFMRKAHKIVEKASERVGHKIQLALRTCRDIDDALVYGFDVETIVKEGLIDLLIIAPNWGATDSDMPIDKWRELIGDFPLIIGMETLCMQPVFSTSYNSKAFAASYYAGGADGIYFNNHMDFTTRNVECWAIDRESCLKGRREFVVTWNDTWIYREKRYKPLPTDIEGSKELPIKVGPINSEDKVVLTINYQGDKIPTLIIDGKKYEGNDKVNYVTARAQSGGKEHILTPDTPVSYYLNGISTDNKLNLIFEGEGTITYVSLAIDSKI